MAEEFGLIAKIAPEIDGGGKSVRDELERNVTGQPLELDVEIPTKKLEEAQEYTLGERAGQVKRAAGAKAKAGAKRAGGAAKQTGKFGAHFAASKALSELGLPVNVPSTSLPGLPQMPGGNTGEMSGPLGGGAGGTTASEPSDANALMQDQLAVQEDQLEVLYSVEDLLAGGSGGSGGGGGAAKGGILAKVATKAGGLGGAGSALAGLGTGGAALSGLGLGVGAVGGLHATGVLGENGMVRNAGENMNVSQKQMDMARRANLGKTMANPIGSIGGGMLAAGGAGLNALMRGEAGDAPGDMTEVFSKLSGIPLDELVDTTAGLGEIGDIPKEIGIPMADDIPDVIDIPQALSDISDGIDIPGIDKLPDQIKIPGLDSLLNAIGAIPGVNLPESNGSGSSSGNDSGYSQRFGAGSGDVNLEANNTLQLDPSNMDTITNEVETMVEQLLTDFERQLTNRMDISWP